MESEKKNRKITYRYLGRTQREIAVVLGMKKDTVVEKCIEKEAELGIPHEGKSVAILRVSLIQYQALEIGRIGTLVSSEVSSISLEYTEVLKRTE